MACNEFDCVHCNSCRPAQVEAPLSRPVECMPPDIHGRLAGTHADVVTLAPDAAKLLGFVHGTNVDVATLIARAVDVAKHRDQLKVALEKAYAEVEEATRGADTETSARRRAESTREAWRERALSAEKAHEECALFCEEVRGKAISERDAARAEAKALRDKLARIQEALES